MSKKEQLKQNCRDMGLPVSGTIAELEARLADHVQSAPETETVAHFEMEKGKHGKTGADIFVAKLVNNVDKESFCSLCDLARKHRGNWSSYPRRLGGIPGFQFKAMADAIAFQNEAGSIMETAKITPREERRSRRNRNAAPTPGLQFNDEGYLLDAAGNATPVHRSQLAA